MQQCELSIFLFVYKCLTEMALAGAPARQTELLLDLQHSKD